MVTKKPLSIERGFIYTKLERVFLMCYNSKKGRFCKMRDDVRDIIAFIVGKYISEKKTSSIYSYEKNSYIQISGDVTERKINVFDYRIKNYLAGNGNNNKFSLYHYEYKKYIDLSFKNNNFEGFDYDSRKHFSGDVKGNSISLYDYDTRKYYNYSL
jgi:hypothetical protein